MNIRLSVVALSLILGTAVWAQTTTAPATAPATATATKPAPDKEHISYALGMTLGEKLQGYELDMKAFADGVKDGSAAKPKMTDDEVDDCLMALSKAVGDIAKEKNQKAGDTFLAENGKKEGIITTASGLQYKVLKSGTGKSPKATDTAMVKYRGTLVSGKEFDSSTEAVALPVNRVIPGWTEALLLMKIGDKFQLYIPAKLAYGERGAGPDIGPNEMLIFDVELVDIK